MSASIQSNLNFPIEKFSYRSLFREYMQEHWVGRPHAPKLFARMANTTIRCAINYLTGATAADNETMIHLMVVDPRWERKVMAHVEACKAARLNAELDNLQLRLFKLENNK